MRTPTFAELQTRIKEYIKDKEHLDIIKDAYEYAYKSHEGQLRKSGEPYIVHPLDVALILSELHTDPVTLVAGLLHDVIEDTDTTYDDIKDIFGEEIALLTEGVTKLGQYKFSRTEKEADKIAAQAKNYQKMLLAMAKDIRVIIVKLADRLNNMRTLNHLSPVKQQRISKETMEI